MSYREEFPDFPEADMPAIPTGFEDRSWKNDVCPGFANEAMGLWIWVDVSDPNGREFPDTPRFSVSRYTEDEGCGDSILLTDDWNEVLGVILGEAFAAACRETYSVEDFAEIRRRNATPEYEGGVCATHDFADANMIMDPCFTEVVGHELDGESDGDCGIWNAAWAWAKKHHLTAPPLAPQAQALFAEIDRLLVEGYADLLDEKPSASYPAHIRALTHKLAGMVTA